MSRLTEWGSDVWVSVILGAGAVIVSYYFWARPRKARLVIEWQISKVSVPVDDLDITYKGDPVHDPHIATLTIRHERGPDLAKEKVEALRFVPRSKGKFAAVALLGGSDKAATLRDETIELTQRSFLKGDQAKITVLTSGAPAYGHVARVVDAQVSQELSRAELPSVRIAGAIGVISMGVGVLLVSWIGSWIALSENAAVLLLIGFVVLFIMGFSFLSVWRETRHWD